MTGTLASHDIDTRRVPAPFWCKKGEAVKLMKSIDME